MEKAKARYRLNAEGTEFKDDTQNTRGMLQPIQAIFELHLSGKSKLKVY